MKTLTETKGKDGELSNEERNLLSVAYKSACVCVCDCVCLCAFLCVCVCEYVCVLQVYFVVCVQHV